MSKKVLIVGPAWVGDMVMAQTLFKSLTMQNPDVTIDVLAPDWTRALLNRMPEVNQAISMPLGHGQFDFMQRVKIGRSLRQHGYDQAFVLPNSWKSAVIPWAAGIKVRTGWRGEMRYFLLNDARTLNKQRWPLMIERFMALSIPAKDEIQKPYPTPELVVDAQSLEKNIAKHQLNTKKPIIALCPGAEFGPSKRWLPEYFADVAKAKIAEGFQVWLFGSKNDEPVAKIIQNNTDNACVNLIGQTNLDEAIDLLSIAKLVLSNDSGLMHIAAALHRPMLAVYGSTSTEFTPPLGEHVNILQLDMTCSPCFKRECPLQHHRCMRDITPEMVLKDMRQLEKAIK